jgi:dehydrogenase/reductase SDR family protein 7B
MSFQNKVVWITGASSGIGEALAYEFSKLNARLIISSRRKDELERVKERCLKLGSRAVEILPLDLANANVLALTTEAAINAFGQIDILINNGGVSQRGLAKDTSLEVDRKIFEINYFGTIALTKAVVPQFIKQGHGHFVTVTSVTGKLGTPYRSSYAASKHALHGFFDSLRAELWKDNPNILVTLVTPGWTNTNLSLTALMGDGSAQGKKDETHEHGLTPEFVANKIVQAIKNKKRELLVAGMKESMAVYVNRFFPNLFAKIIRKAKVK